MFAFTYCRMWIVECEIKNETIFVQVICAENLQTLLGGKCPYEKIQLYDVDEEESEENDDFEDGLIVIQVGWILSNLMR